MTYVALANITLGSSASSVTFSSIPNTFRDLVLIDNVIMTSTPETGSIFARYNSDSGSNYPYIGMWGTTSNTTASGSGTLTGAAISRISSANRSAGVTSILDYSATDKHKMTLSRGNVLGQPTLSVIAIASRWTNTAAISSITLVPESSTFAAGSTFALYGIRS